MNNKELTEEIVRRNLKALEADLYLCEANETGAMWEKYVSYLTNELNKSNDEIKREAVEESMLLRLSSRVHAMFRDAIDPESVSGYNEALDDVQDMIQEYLTQQSLDGGDE